MTLSKNNTLPSQGIHVDPTLNPLASRAWHPDIAAALDSPEMATYRSVLTLDDQDVRTSILQELADYHGYTPEECLKRCLHWEDWSVEEWAAADRSTPEGNPRVLPVRPVLGVRPHVVCVLAVHG